jgi:hypothetical protein
VSEEPESSGASRDAKRRSRRRGYGGRSTRAAIGVGNMLHAPAFERWLHIAVAVLAFVYLGIMVFSFHADTVMLGYRSTGAPQSEILYGFGRPEFVRAGGGAPVRVQADTPLAGYDIWQYPAEGGGTFLFHFNGAQISDRVSCSHPAGERGNCPSVFGIGLGEKEESIIGRLGAPSDRILHGTSATLRYASLGVEFELEQFRLRGIALSTNRYSVPGRIPVFIRYLMP